MQNGSATEMTYGLECICTHAQSHHKVKGGINCMMPGCECAIFVRKVGDGNVHPAGPVADYFKDCLANPRPFPHPEKNDEDVCGYCEHFRNSHTETNPRLKCYIVAASNEPPYTKAYPDKDTGEELETHGCDCKGFVDCVKETEKMTDKGLGDGKINIAGSLGEYFKQANAVDYGADPVAYLTKKGKEACALLLKWGKHSLECECFQRGPCTCGFSIEAIQLEKDFRP